MLQVSDISSSTWTDFIAYLLVNVLSIIPTAIRKLCPKCISNWIKWCPSSPQALELAERQVLAYLERPFSVKYVNIGPCVEKGNDMIWTLTMAPEKVQDNTPLVLIHGFASGIGLWISNLDSLSSNRVVYAFDLIGFGRSSHPTFSSNSLEAENQFITCIESWRKSMGLQRFILLGHGMGGFLAASYALRHPNNVAHLILADPWGYSEKPLFLFHQYELPYIMKILNSIFHFIYPLSLVRLAGPLGPILVERLRGDLQKKFRNLIKDTKVIPSYIYHCNAQKPSGEAAFQAMVGSSGWAKHPLVGRMDNLDPHIPITFVYGSRSWAILQPSLQTKYSRLNSFVDVQVIDCAGHHVYADKPEQFNSLIHRICDSVDD